MTEIAESLKSIIFDTADPLALLILFIPPEIYATIAENTNLYRFKSQIGLVFVSTGHNYKGYGVWDERQEMPRR